MKVAFLTLGCKVNHYETDLLKEKFEAAGHTIVDFEELADVYVVNSCSVTNMSDRKTRQMLSRARHNNKDAVIAVLGCSVEGKKEHLEEFDADIILGNEDKSNLLEIVEEYIKTKNKKTILTDVNAVKKYQDVGTMKSGYEIREEIKIEDGCNNFCSYCIIPYVRGRVRSRELDSIVKETKSLVNNGVKEIILVGIEVASYGQDLNGLDLFNVIDELEKIEGLERIRLSSMMPRFLTEENIKRLAGYTKLCPHFHISMQSGNTEVLKRMNRKYGKELLIEVCGNLKRYFNNPYLAADVIVGFPGETNEEFEDTIDTINKMGLTEIHVFKYSKRNYTRAAKMDNQIDGVVKKERSNIVLNLSKKLNKEFLNMYLGKKVKVLFENYEDGVLLGYTENYIKVCVKGDKRLCGTVQDVVVQSLEEERVLAEVI
ncbi:MAG: tRNA (N(6)-L-threonylcarbamoyladenosine(37)-C(2))-methylthiotransferase MtaB [Clostridia bacterium]|nr:tRNA (N(6)-L-threonylcarbamoyladenosine(37)-C(2))-methylthiotransferase MtaB [Clostridia bacterium]MBR6641349.1 tRNA (N(6)-L-threonylcarbamoyladenosine(37)-C(2))-methylthiotransferase MtaB [Clostridia bacterium]